MVIGTFKDEYLGIVSWLNHFNSIGRFSFAESVAASTMSYTSVISWAVIDGRLFSSNIISTSS